MLKTGERAPEFSLPDHSGRDTSLTSLLNSGALLLWFFSGFPNPASSIAARKIGDLYAELNRRGIVVAGISPRTPARLQGLRQRHNLPFVLLSDGQKSVAHMYQRTGLLGVRGGTYLISRGRTILGSEADPIGINKQLNFMREAPELVLGMPLHF
jgi:thioredoxin-dependent peroxiredoxin